MPAAASSTPNLGWPSPAGQDVEAKGICVLGTSSGPVAWPSLGDGWCGTVGDRMTKRKHLKRRVRERSAKTGESYAAALRHLRTRNKERHMSTPETDLLISCSFCSKTNKMVKKLIAGPGVYICDECIGLCDDILAEEEVGQPAPSLDDSPVERLLSILGEMATTTKSMEANLARWAKRLQARGASVNAIARAVGVSDDEARQRFEL
jgi:hypothetical protein